MDDTFCGGMTYTVKKGDTLYEISRSYHVPLELLLRANPYVDVFQLKIGDTLCIPSKEPYKISDSADGVSSSAPMEDGQGEETGEETEADCDPAKKEWIRYVVQPGDTLADVLKGMDGSVAEFLERNDPSVIYMLPGVAYAICPSQTE